MHTHCVRNLGRIMSHIRLGGLNTRTVTARAPTWATELSLRSGGMQPNKLIYLVGMRYSAAGVLVECAVHRPHCGHASVHGRHLTTDHRWLVTAQRWPSMLLTVINAKRTGIPVKAPCGHCGGWRYPTSTWRTSGNVRPDA